MCECKRGTKGGRQMAPGPCPISRDEWARALIAPGDPFPWKDWPTATLQAGCALWFNPTSALEVPDLSLC